MVSAYAHNDLLLGVIDSITGKGADLDAAALAFQSCPGDFAARFTAAVQAALAGQVRPEVFIQIPDQQQRQELSKAQLEALVRPAAGWLKSYPSKSELLDELDDIDCRQQRRPAWIPRTTVDGQLFEPDDSKTDEPERELVVEAFPELGRITVHLPAAWDERPELSLAEGGIGQWELALYCLLGIGDSGDWQGGLILDADANEALVPHGVRWWAHGESPRPLTPGQDAGVASELLATIPTLGAVPVRETDGSIEVMARALARAECWRHSPQWTLQSWDPASDAALFTAARASLAAWADESGSGLAVYVAGAVLHQHDGILSSPGPLHSFLLCIARAGGDEVAMVHRLVLTCPGEHWCRRGGCATADGATVAVLAPLLLPIGESAQLAAAARRHDLQGMYQDLYGPGGDGALGEPVLDLCAGVLQHAGWKELNRAEIDGGLEELLVRRGDRFLTVVHDPVTRQIMLRDGTSDLELLMQMLYEDGVIVTSGGREVVDTSEQIVDVWGLDALTAASDILRGRRVSTDQQPAFQPVQATLLGMHPAGPAAVTVPGAQVLCESQLGQLLRHIGAAEPTMA